MKFITIACVLFAVFFTAAAQSTSYADYYLKKYPIVTSADSAWQNRPLGKSKYDILRSPEADLINPDPKDKLRQRFFDVSKRVMHNFQNLERRKWGIVFWKKFPDDKRRFVWLRATMSTPVIYWENTWLGSEDELEARFIAPLDVDRKQEWDKQYTLFKNEMLNAIGVPENDKQELIYYELRNILYDMRFPDARGRDGFDYKDWAEKLIAYSAYYYKYIYDKNSNGRDNVKWMSYSIFNEPNILDLNEEKQEDFLKILANSRVRELAKYANDRLSLFYLREKPFELKDYTYTGELIDLKKMQKKVILIDFWSIGCTGCIAAMPHIKSIYEKYKDQGFEVVSIDISGANYKDKAIEIHKKVGAGWPLITMEKANWEKIFNRYSWVGVPQLLLLDKEKKLIMYNDQLLDHKTMEALVQRMIKED